MIKYLKSFKFLVIVLSFAFCVLRLPGSAFAQAPASSSSTSKESKPTFEVSQTTPLPPTVSPTSPLYTDLLIHNIFHSFSCLATGQSVIGQPCLTYQFQKNAQGALQGVPVLSSANLSGGALGAVTGLIAGLYQNPPVRTSEYIGSLGEQLGIVKQAHAQGVVGSGAGVLKPIETLWQVSRNIAYVIMIVIFVVIGMMIIFRQKINPQTVITAQAALPGLVIGLILITFSYFLAGLISDTAFIGTNLVGAYFSAVKGQPDKPQNLVQDISDKNVMSLMGLFLNGITKEPITDGVGAFFNNLTDPASRYVRSGIALAAYQVGSGFGPALGALAGLAICGVPALAAMVIPGVNALAAGGTLACATVGSTIGGPVVGGILGASAAVDPPAMAGLGLYFIALIIIVYSIFRLLMRLINSFLTIIFLVVTAPFQFLFSSLPGRQGIATDWFLNLLSNILAFPAVLAVFYFIAFLLGQSFGPFTVSELNNRQEGILPSVYAQENKISITGSNNFPLFGGLNLGFINFLLAFGALVAVPAVPDVVQRAIGKASEAGRLIGQEVSSGIAGGQKYYGQAQGGIGAASRDVGGLRPLGGQRQFTIDPNSGQLVALQEPGLWGRMLGRGTRRLGTVNPKTGRIT